MSAQCLISFGSNLGDRDALIAGAARRIAATPGLGQLRTSRLFETPPIGGPGGQEPFLNAVAAFETSHSAREILAILHETEQHLGRRRRDRWGARSIDLDVVLHGALVGGGTALTVPHPRYTARQFVLQPACDVAADYRDPRFGWPLDRLARHLSEGVPSLALCGGDAATRQLLCEQLEEKHGIQSFPGAALAEPMQVLANVPAVSWELSSAAGRRRPSSLPAITPQAGQPWVSAFVPDLPQLDSPNTSQADVPRLIVRLQYTAPKNRWPAPHQIWPAGWRWPEYRLEIDDLPWAVDELASALTSMRCPVEPITASGDWW